MIQAARFDRGMGSGADAGADLRYWFDDEETLSAHAERNTGEWHADGLLLLQWHHAMRRM